MVAIKFTQWKQLKAVNKSTATVKAQIPVPCCPFLTHLAQNHVLHGPWSSHGFLWWFTGTSPTIALAASPVMSSRDCPASSVCEYLDHCSRFCFHSHFCSRFHRTGWDVALETIWIFVGAFRELLSRMELNCIQSYKEQHVLVALHPKKCLSPNHALSINFHLCLPTYPNFVFPLSPQTHTVLKITGHTAFVLFTLIIQERVGNGSHETSDLCSCPYWKSMELLRGVSRY